MSATNTNSLRDFADNPSASGMVPIAPATLRAVAEEIDQLKALNAELAKALEDAQQAINGMKTEAENGSQGDEEMLLDALNTISIDGLEADTAIRAALAKHKGETT